MLFCWLYIVNFEQISHIFLVWYRSGGFIVNFEHRSGVMSVWCFIVIVFIVFIEIVCNFIVKENPAQVFFMNFVKFSECIFFTEHLLWRLLLLLFKSSCKPPLMICFLTQLLSKNSKFPKGYFLRDI